ncbi:MAG: TM1812 family CRISPR-associated protein [Candidatus Verstraetearchaeota archaeon]|nr:TM1812 family CRISPR-associated protein [Candidatus Verstraetearchaeota archaeon]
MFDLTPLLDLLEWISGTEVLFARGDATFLAQTLRLHIEKDPNPKISDLANKLKFFSKALCYSRPIEVMSCAEELSSLLSSCNSESLLRPFLAILEQIKKDISELAHRNPQNLEHLNLLKQTKIIEYCLRKGMIVQAITLSREWVVSYVCIRENIQEHWLERDTREGIEKRLNTLVKDPESYPLIHDVRGIWGGLRELRNNIAHCGMSPSPVKISKIENKANEIASSLKNLLPTLSSQHFQR